MEHREPLASLRHVGMHSSLMLTEGPSRLRIPLGHSQVSDECRYALPSVPERVMSGSKTREIPSQDTEAKFVRLLSSFTWAKMLDVWGVFLLLLSCPVPPPNPPLT